MARLLQSEIHSEFSSDSGIWQDYRNQITGFYSEIPKSELDMHVSREFNRKIQVFFGIDSALILSPFNAGFSYVGSGISF